MKKKDLIYIPHQDTWTERFPNPGSNKNDYTLYLSDPQAQYNIQEINPYLQDILQNPEDLVSLSQHHKR